MPTPDPLDQDEADAGSFLGQQRRWLIITVIAAIVFVAMMLNPYKEKPAERNPATDSTAAPDSLRHLQPVEE